MFIGERYCTINVHSLLHYVQCVRIRGPLWATMSAFGFESWNSDFKFLFHGTQAIENQVNIIIYPLKCYVFILITAVIVQSSWACRRNSDNQFAWSITLYKADDFKLGHFCYIYHVIYFLLDHEFSNKLAKYPRTGIKIETWIPRINIIFEVNAWL